MIRRCIFAFAAATLLSAYVATAGDASPPPVPAPIASQGYHLKQDWDFVHGIRDGEQLRQAFYTRYVYADGKLDHLGDEWERYRDDGNHAFASDSLRLVARLRGSSRPGKIESGMVRSRWIGLYGYYEAEVRVPKGRSLWSAFWLNPDDGTWPPEIDVFEIVDGPHDNTTCSFHFLHPASGPTPAETTSRLDAHHRYCPGWDFAERFHRMAVLWTPTRVDHYVDDVLVASRPFSWTHADGRPAGPAHILLNLAVGGGWAGPPTSDAVFPAELAVRYVRVWQRP